MRIIKRYGASLIVTSVVAGGLVALNLYYGHGLLEFSLIDILTLAVLGIGIYIIDIKRDNNEDIVGRTDILLTEIKDLFSLLCLQDLKDNKRFLFSMHSKSLENKILYLEACAKKLGHKDDVISIKENYNLIVNFIDDKIELTDKAEDKDIIVLYNMWVNVQNSIDSFALKLYDIEL